MFVRENVSPYSTLRRAIIASQINKLNLNFPWEHKMRILDESMFTSNQPRRKKQEVSIAPRFAKVNSDRVNPPNYPQFGNPKLNLDLKAGKFLNFSK